MAERGEEQPQTQDNSKRKHDEIQIAKQKAQEIVARLVNSAESKRPRVDDSSDPPSASFPQVPSYPDVTQKPAGQLAPNSQVIPTPFVPQSASYYGSQTSKRISIPNGKVGVIIGKGGETIKSLQLQSGAKIQITKDSDADLYAQTRDVALTGTPEQVTRAEQLINDVIAEADAGGSGPTAGRGPSSMPHGVEQVTMQVPNDKVALIIGKGGETIKTMQGRSGARIQIIPLHLPPGDTSTERTVFLNGTSAQIESAKELVNEILSGNRLRIPPTQGGYTQQNYNAPGNWAQPPVQQPSYAYAQPGSYPTPYYNYPQQATGWDQSNTATAPPPPVQYAGYNYYGQQAQTDVGSTQTDVNYAYGQAPPATNQTNDQSYSQQPQSYGQDTPSQVSQQGYSQQPQSYGQDTTSQVLHQGYSQQPQSYGQDSQVPQPDQQKSYTTPGYGPPAEPSQPDGTVPNHPYGTQPSTQQPPAYHSSTPAPAYQSSTPPPPAYSVPYSQPPAVSPAEYGTSHSYGAPLVSQPGYDQTGYPQSGYAGQQPQQLPPSATQPVYGQSGYPQPAPAQSSYTQAAAPLYGQPPHAQPPTYHLS